MKREGYAIPVFVIVTFFTISMILIIQIFISRRQTLNEINTSITNLTHTLDTYTEGVIRQTEILINNISDTIEVYGMDVSQQENLKKIISGQEKFIGSLNNIVIYDTRGEKFVALYDNIQGGSNVADRIFFIHHQNIDSKEVFIGPPIISRTNGAWVLSVSRRIENAKGVFQGVIVITLRVKNFLELYGKIDIGHSGVIALTSDSGVLLIRYPYSEKYIGQVLLNSPLFTTYLKQHDSGTARTTSRFDKVERIYSFQRNLHYGLVTTVAVGLDEAMSSWRHQTEWLAFIVLMLTGGIVCSGYWLILDFRKKAKISRDLSKAKDSLILANAQLMVMATEDALTGLANRRRFDDELLVEVSRCARINGFISLLLIDVDYFKKYNDNYGHLAGDECLGKIGGILKNSIRRTGELAARYGGEEFVVLLPGTDITGANVVAQRIMANLEKENIPHAHNPLGRVTVSIGIFSSPADLLIGKEEQLIFNADTALYQAKAAGRHQVCTYNGE